jgi:hypothetical protein
VEEVNKIVGVNDKQIVTTGESLMAMGVITIIVSER